MKKYAKQEPQVKADKFADIRVIPFNKDLPVFATPSLEVLTGLSYNEKTRFSDPTLPNKILEMAKEPPLGIRDIHKMGLTGKGVYVAIIDQPLALDHPEYKGKIFAYKNFCAPDQISSMHGPAVASLLAGETIGVAPDTKIIFAAIPSWERDAEYPVSALDWIMEENKKLAPEQKIKFISVSAAFGERKFKSNKKWIKKVQEVQDSGICVIEGTKNIRFVSECYIEPQSHELKFGYPDEPENGPGHEPYNLVYAPNSMRTVAESYDNEEFSYTYWGVGGLSWGIPYVAGVLALGQQANPMLSAEELRQILIKTAKENGQIIDPKAFIKEVQKAQTTTLEKRYNVIKSKV